MLAPKWMNSQPARILAIARVYYDILWFPAIYPGQWSSFSGRGCLQGQGLLVEGHVGVEFVCVYVKCMWWNRNNARGNTNTLILVVRSQNKKNTDPMLFPHTQKDSFSQ